MSHRKYSRHFGHPIHSRLMKEQFKDDVREKPDADRQLRNKLLLKANRSLLTAAEWCEKKETTWAQVMAEQAVKLIEAAKSLE